MTINENYAIELLLGSYLKGHDFNNGYCAYYLYEAQISNPVLLDKWLLTNGFLRKPTIEEALSWYKVPQLKECLTSINLKTSGKKAELIARIIENAPNQLLEHEKQKCSKYYLSQKGLDYYYQNQDLELLHKYWKYSISLEEYFNYRYKKGIEKDFYQIAYHVLKTRTDTAVKNKTNIRPYDFYNLSELCVLLDKNDVAIQAILFKLYCDVNFIGTTYLFDPTLIKLNDIDNMCSHIDKTYAFNIYTVEQIVKLSDFYSPIIVDNIYSLKITNNILLSKKDFVLAIDDMINSAHFDADYYIQIMIKNYRKLAGNITQSKKTSFIQQLLHIFKLPE